MNITICVYVCPVQLTNSSLAILRRRWLVGSGPPTAGRCATCLYGFPHPTSREQIRRATYNKESKTDEAIYKYIDT